METTVAGVNFKNADGTIRASIIERMSKDDKICLERDPDNKYDRNAVKVCVLLDGIKHQIGFLERRIAAEVSHRMLLGESFPVSVIRRGNYNNGRYRGIYCRIEIENIIYYDYIEDFRLYLSLYKKIDELDLQSVFYEALKNNNIETVKDLVQTDKKKINKIRVIKDYGLDEIEIALHSLRLDFGAPIDEIEKKYNLFMKGLYMINEFVDEEYVSMFLANQSFRSSDGSSICFENNRMRVNGTYSGVVSVLQCTLKSAVITSTKHDAEESERKINVQFADDKLQLTDPIDGKVYYKEN